MNTVDWFYKYFCNLKIKVALISCRWSKVRSKAGENNGLIRPPAEIVPGLGRLPPLAHHMGLGSNIKLLWLPRLGVSWLGVIWLTPCSGYERGDNVFTLCVCVCVSVYVCHDVCPDDLTMKDWCHTNNILQVHCWGCLVVQVMFHALMTSLMTSQDHKVGQILKLIYLRQYLSYSVDQKLKMSEMLMAIFLVYSTSGITPGKKNCRELKMAAILKILKY